MDDAKCHHPHRTIGKIRHQYQAAGSMWMTEFSVTLMLWRLRHECGFFNSGITSVD
jgi:hypothetical protein